MNAAPAQCNLLRSGEIKSLSKILTCNSHSNILTGNSQCDGRHSSHISPKDKLVLNLKHWFDFLVSINSLTLFYVFFSFDIFDFRSQKLHSSDRYPPKTLRIDSLACLDYIEMIQCFKI